MQDRFALFEIVQLRSSLRQFLWPLFLFPKKRVLGTWTKAIRVNPRILFFLVCSDLLRGFLLEVFKRNNIFNCAFIALFIFLALYPFSRVGKKCLVNYVYIEHTLSRSKNAIRTSVCVCALQLGPGRGEVFSRVERKKKIWLIRNWM